ncbi:MAG: hypothetical protein EXQ85_08485 [Alphaproteobacteria bacterium]|nr:hypothetical protein [Alphaproteobacteria bacterium]
MRRHHVARALAVTAAIALAGCAELIPKFELRDDYMFKRYVQPSRISEPPRHDEQGNPILPAPGPAR